MNFYVKTIVFDIMEKKNHLLGLVYDPRFVFCQHTKPACERTNAPRLCKTLDFFLLFYRS